MTMKWEKCSNELTDVLAAAMIAIPSQRRMMFGCPTYSSNGNMFTGVHQSDIFIRLSAADRKAFLAAFDEVSPFEPVAGHVMKEYVTVPAAVYDHPEIFATWLNKSLKTVAALPAKLPKPKSVKKDSS